MVGGCALLLFRTGYGLVVGSREHSNELLGSIRGREFLEKLIVT